MQLIEKNSLFTEVTLEETALVSGGQAKEGGGQGNGGGGNGGETAPKVPGFNLDNYFGFLGASAVLGGGITKKVLEKAVKIGYGIGLSGGGGE
ncbi:hypothetical protein BZZ01_01295 [Nostocales cyanobacterium HT-58-2]|nr:hypothetical protein BZZ01_01295 [Nostocales cyanobacterium HT-58-2]